MKTIKLRVGKKSSDRDAVHVPLQVAENLGDVQTLAKDKEAVIVRCFNRGWRILNQEGSGARDAFGDGKSEEEIAALIAGFDASEIKERVGRPKKPVKLSTGGKKSMTVEDFKAQLAAQGVNVEIE